MLPVIPNTRRFKALSNVQILMEDYLDEWHGYAFTGQYLGSSGNGDAGVEYVIFVFSPRGFLFEQHARLTTEQLAELGSGEDPRSAQRLLQEEALNRAKKRIREKNYQPFERYD